VFVAFCDAMNASGPDQRSAEPTSSRGSCLCGAIGFVAALPSKWVAHCHCSRCRRAHGAPFVTWAGFAADAVTVEDERSNLRFIERLKDQPSNARRRPERLHERAFGRRPELFVGRKIVIARRDDDLPAPARDLEQAR